MTARRECWPMRITCARRLPKSWIWDRVLSSLSEENTAPCCSAGIRSSWFLAIFLTTFSTRPEQAIALRAASSVILLSAGLIFETATLTSTNFTARLSMALSWEASVVNSLALSGSVISHAKKSTTALRNSGASLPSRSIPLRELSAVGAALSLLILLAAWWTFREGYILYYGDAQAHLNISRSIIDSRTPGHDQLGTVWLPILHLLCLPLVGNTWLWSTGLAGTVPVALCFILAGTFFYAAAREVYGSVAPAGVVVTCFALNPNILY